jgi:putative sterol carrier protein
MLEAGKIKKPQDLIDMVEEELQSNPAKYSGKNFRCQFDISGENGGSWYVLINDKKKVVTKGTLKDPVCTVMMKESDFIRLVHGDLNAPMALLTGKIKIKGDMNHAIKLVETILS